MRAPAPPQHNGADARNEEARSGEGFSQALVKLPDNAAEASEAAGSDLARVTVAGDADRIRLYVDDEGPGLGEEVQRRVGKAVYSRPRRSAWGWG